jgi:hypothetical protein
VHNHFELRKMGIALKINIHVQIGEARKVSSAKKG